MRKLKPAEKARLTAQRVVRARREPDAYCPCGEALEPGQVHYCLCCDDMYQQALKKGALIDLWH